MYKRYGDLKEIRRSRYKLKNNINPLKPELNPICYLLALLGAHHFLHVSRIRVKLDIIEDGYTVLEWIQLLPDWAYWQLSVYTMGPGVA